MVRDDTFFEYVYRNFYKFSEVQPKDFGILFSKNLTFPLLESIHEPVMIIPLPKLVDDKFVYEGMAFENTPEGRRSMWSLFLATLYHLSAHAATSSYSKYVKWIKRKTPEKYWQVIDFIEDVISDRYLYHKDKEIWQNVIGMEKLMLENRKTSKLSNSASSTAFQDAYDRSKIASVKDEIIKNIGKDDFDEKILSIATQLYRNKDLVQKPILPFQDRHNRSWSPKTEVPGLEFEPFGVFEDQVQELDSLWELNERERNKILKRYRKYLKGLNFDSIVLPPGDIQSYEKIKLRTLPMLRRIRQQIRMISNLADDPKLDEIGYIDMQMAIQAIASEGATSEIFERDELRRGEEAWVILIDKSASMKLRFNEIHEFAVTVSESANELTGKADAWALYSFDNNFQILKDFKEKFNQETKARIGTLENGGLSLLPDAIELSARVLLDDPRERKFIFVITDGHPSGYDGIHQAFSKSVKKTEISGITLIGIGVTKSISRKFRNHAKATDLKQLVIKFISAYKAAAMPDS